jgi:putative NADH-flavin reductase
MLLGLSLGHEAQAVSSGPEEAEEPASSSSTYRRGMKVLIIGATGATGQILMREALAQGHEVTALARNPSALLAPEDHRLRVLQGNALDASEVEAAVAGQDAVLSALGTRSSRPTTLFSESTHNLISAMDKHGVRRLVCITGIGVGDSKGHVGFLYDRIIRPFVVKNVYEDKERQEEAIKQSDLDWVIVRPARLTDESAKGEYRVYLGGSYTAKTISRADVAAFMLAQLTDDTYVRKMPVISY